MSNSRSSGIRADAVNLGAIAKAGYHDNHVFSCSTAADCIKVTQDQMRIKWRTEFKFQALVSA